MKLYYPECFTEAIDYVGYNHAVRLFRKTLGEYVTKDSKGADFRVYINLPWHPNPILLKEGLPLFVYSMYEADRVPSSWVKFLNNHASIIGVPSNWCKKIFISSGVLIPIIVIPLGIDPEEIPYLPKRPEKDRYVYLWQGVALDPGGRKGVDVAIDAFKGLKKEGKIPNSELVLKFRPYKHRNLTIGDVRSTTDIRYIQEDLPREKLLELYKEVDACINPTHGEGFGLIPLEQMAMGKPVMVTDWSMDYVRDIPCLPLDYTLKESPVTWNHKHLAVSKNGLWYNVGGLRVEVNWLPRFFKYRPTAKSQILRPPWEKPRTIGKVEHIKNSLINLICNLQRKAGLARDPNRKPYTFFQENPGRDAFVNIDHLKKQMVWCYDNREEAYTIGINASVKARRDWTIDRMKKAFDQNKNSIRS